jgi:hypothetical protein
VFTYNQDDIQLPCTALTSSNPNLRPEPRNRNGIHKRGNCCRPAFHEQCPFIQLEMSSLLYRVLQPSPHLQFLILVASASSPNSRCPKLRWIIRIRSWPHFKTLSSRLNDDLLLDPSPAIHPTQHPDLILPTVRPILLAFPPVPSSLASCVWSAIDIRPVPELQLDDKTLRVPTQV